MTRAGVDVVAKGPGVVELHWAPDTDQADLQRVVREGLATSWHRVEAYLPVDDPHAHRLAARAGMRREGVLRGILGASPGGDRVVFARLADDPATDSRGGFSAILDTTMPMKRVIAQGLLRDPDGRVLLCETTYKKDWDLPGGIVDPDEPPAQTVAREVREELGLDLPVGRLLVTNWMPRYLGWSDAVQLVYDLGVTPADIEARMSLSSHEIRAVHWEATPQRCAPYEQRVVEAASAVAAGAPVVELHDGHPRHD